MRKKIILAISIFSILIILSYVLSKGVTYVGNRVRDYYSNKVDSSEYLLTNINLYRNTPAWDLAMAVEDERTSDIEKIVRDKPELLKYQEPKYGMTLLIWSVGMEKYDSAKMLLKCGADPEIATTSGGETPLFIAAGFSWVDNNAKEDSKYVKLLLSYGANPNKSYAGSSDPNRRSGMESGESPLMNSIGCGIEKTKALVEGGADINYKTKSGATAAIYALGRGGPNATVEGMQYAYYLIVEKKAKVNEPSYRADYISDSDDNPNDKFYPVDQLRTWVYKLDSEQYKIKMDIIREFSNQGVDYWSTEIPKDTLKGIKKLYPDTWEDYIKKY